MSIRGTGSVFYVGKGCGNRAFMHLDSTGPSRKARIIRSIRAEGKEPQVEFLVHGLEDEATALKVEAAVIDLLGLDQLVNMVGGHGCREFGRRTAEELVAQYEKKEARIGHPVILIRINQLYRSSMTPAELYDATRGIWKIQPERAKKAKYALAVYDRIVREVYEIAQWLPAGSTFSTRNATGIKRKGRFEFVGTVAPEAVRRQYLLRSVDGYLADQAQNPIAYVRC